MKGKILIGVTGGIAAYKTCEVVRALYKQGFDVYVVMTENATKFVSPATFEVLSGHKVLVSLWERTESSRIEHIDLSRDVDLIAIIPATANIIGKFASE